VLNSAAILVRQVGAGIIQLITLIIIARIYGAEGNGIYSVALLLPTMLAVFLNLGISPANIYFIGTGKVDHKMALRISMGLFSFLVLVGLTFGGLIVHFFSEHWFPGVPESSLWVAVSIFPAIFMLNILSGIFQGLQKFNVYNYLAIIPPLSTLMIIAFFIAFEKKGINYLLFSYLAGFVLAIFASLYWFAKLQVDHLVPKNNNYVNDMLVYGYKAHISNLMSFINYKLDLFLVNLLVGPLAAGVYVVAVQLGERLWILAQSVSSVLLPRLSQFEGREDLRDKMTPIISRWVFCLTVVASLLLAASGYPLLRFVFGKEFLPALSPLLYLLPGIVAGALSKILASDIAARGKPELNMYTTFASVPLNLAGNLLLIPWMGLSGAALATSITYVLILAMILWIYKSLTGITPAKVLFLRKADLKRVFS
jgi:O-antigen/teichoic acid export membrane protein